MEEDARVKSLLTTITAALLCFGLVACSYLGRVPPTSTAITTGIFAAVVPPPDLHAVSLYSDNELRSLAQFGSGPTPSVQLPEGTHVEYIDTEQRVAYIAYQQEPRRTDAQYFRHVRVVDGASRGVEGWIASQLLKP